MSRSNNVDNSLVLIWKEDAGGRTAVLIKKPQEREEWGWVRQECLDPHNILRWTDRTTKRVQDGLLNWILVTTLILPLLNPQGIDLPLSFPVMSDDPSVDTPRPVFSLNSYHSESKVKGKVSSPQIQWPWIRTHDFHKIDLSDTNLVRSRSSQPSWLYNDNILSTFRTFSFCLFVCLVVCFGVKEGGEQVLIWTLTLWTKNKRNTSVKISRHFSTETKQNKTTSISRRARYRDHVKWVFDS